MSFKPRATDPLPRLRTIVSSLPDTSETISHGAPTWWGGKRTFAAFHAGQYDDGRPAVWFKAPPGLQEALVESDPIRFYRPKYLGPSGWVGLRLTAGTDWEELEALLAQGHGLVHRAR